MRILLILLTLGATSVYSQTAPKRKPAAAPAVKPPARTQSSWPLEALNIKGNKFYSSEQIATASGLKIGQPTSNADLDAARLRLMATGAFQTVGFQFGPAPDEKGYIATFEVFEIEQLYPYRFEDLPASEAELRAVLQKREPLLGERIPGTKEMLDRMADELQEFLTPKGWKDHVVAKLVADRPNELTAVFRSSKPPLTIAAVRFKGNEVLPSSLLHNTLTEVAVGIAFSEVAVRQLLDSSIRPLYEVRGRLRVAFPSVTYEKSKDVEGVVVTIQVTEGASYNFGSVRVASTTLDADELAGSAKIRKGDVANFEMVQAGVDRIQKRFHSEGYMRSETTVERQIHDAEKTVDVVFKTQAGPRFVMGRLTISGLDVTTEPAIRKLWSMKEGKPYNAGYPQLFLDRVNEDGYLENLRSTRFEQTVNEESKTVDVTLYFKGGPDPNQQQKKRPGPPQ